jgi:ring-1,2-phenylacetyl-CoA epoxidase subunit PaaD
MVATTTIEKKVWSILESVTDPEVPVLTVIDLGIIRNVKINGEEIEVVITPNLYRLPGDGYDNNGY